MARGDDAAASSSSIATRVRTRGGSRFALFKRSSIAFDARLARENADCDPFVRLGFSCARALFHVTRCVGLIRILFPFPGDPVHVRPCHFMLPCGIAS